MISAQARIVGVSFRDRLPERKMGTDAIPRSFVASPEQELLNIGIVVRRDAGVQNDGEVCLEK
jgi:hypothetical protein